VHQIPEGTKRNEVGYAVLHGYAAGNGLKEMLVVPNGIGANPLFVYKIREVPYMGNFGCPIHGNPKKRPNFVMNKQTWVHLFRDFSHYIKTHVRRGYLFQVRWTGKKIPCLLQGNGQLLGSF
jgi:hypothetical protein